MAESAIFAIVRGSMGVQTVIMIYLVTRMILRAVGMLFAFLL